MTALGQFVATVYTMVVNGKWDELQEYFALMREVIANPSVTVRLHPPTDKEL